MNNQMPYLNVTRNAFTEVASQIDDVVKKGDEQADTRKGIIQTINEMCDALQLACDLIARELSAGSMEFNQVKKGKDLCGAYVLEQSGKFLASLIHQGWVNLVIDETIHFENPVTKILTLIQDTIFEMLHFTSGLGILNVNSPIHITNLHT